MPVASFTVTKLRWLADHEPEAAARTAAVCLPHDWLTWRLLGAAGSTTWPPTAATPAAPATGRPPTAPTGRTCWPGPSATTPLLPRVLAPREAGRAARAARRAARRRHRRQRRGRARPGRRPGRRGRLDRHLGRGLRGRPRSRPPTRSGSSPASPTPPAASCRWSRTLNAARVLDADRPAARRRPRRAHRARALGAGRRRRAGAGALPRGRAHARTGPTPPASLHGLTLGTSTPGDARPGRGRGAALRARRRASTPLVAQGARVDRVLLVGGGAASRGGPRDRAAGPRAAGRTCRPADEYVARGAARQAAWALAGASAPPGLGAPRHHDVHDAPPVPAVRARYAEARDATLDRLPSGG